MIYEFKITETSSTIIPVRAKNPDEAQKIFNDWYRKHDEELNDGYIAELLDDGYEGREITRLAGKPESIYDGGFCKRAVMLPEEESTPQEPTYHLHIRFADGSNSVDFNGKTLREIGMEMAAWGDKYYLFPDAGEGGLLSDNFRGYDKQSDAQTFWVYAVLKDKPETWYSMEAGLKNGMNIMQKGNIKNYEKE